MLWCPRSFGPHPRHRHAIPQFAELCASRDDAQPRAGERGLPGRGEVQIEVERPLGDPRESLRGNFREVRYIPHWRPSSGTADRECNRFCLVRCTYDRRTSSVKLDKFQRIRDRVYANHLTGNLFIFSIALEYSIDIITVIYFFLTFSFVRSKFVELWYLLEFLVNLLYNRICRATGFSTYRLDDLS